MEKRNGFTLMELLAVIVILAIILLISVPLILNVINDARKGAFRNTAYGIIKSTENEYMRLIYHNEGLRELLFIYSDGVESSNPTGKKLNYKGTKPISGTVTTNQEGEVAVALFDGKWCAEKDYKEFRVVLTDKTQNDCNLSVVLPTIELVGEKLQYIEINTNYIEGGVIARSIDGALITDVSIIIKENNRVVDKIDTTTANEYQVIYSVVDNYKEVSLTRKVVVRDTVAPDLIVPGTTTLKVEEVNSFNYLTGVSVTDNSLEKINIEVSGSVSRLPGEYIITYSAHDSANNKSVIERKIIVVDDQAPVITILGNNPITINIRNTYSDAGATAIDNVDGNITSKITTSGTVNTSIEGLYHVTYSVVDSSGNKTSVVRAVRVVDSAKIMTVVIPEGGVDVINLSRVVTIPYLNQVKVKSVTNGGSATLSINGNNVTVNSTNGKPIRTVNNPRKYSRLVSDSMTSSTNSFPATRPYNQDGFVLDIPKSGASTVVSGSYTEGHYKYGSTYREYVRPFGTHMSLWEVCEELFGSNHKIVDTEIVGAHASWYCYIQTKTWTPAVDTRVWRQNYSGTAYKAGVDNYYSYQVVLEYSDNSVPMS